MTARNAIRKACLAAAPIFMTIPAATSGVLPLGIAPIGDLLARHAKVMFTTLAAYPPVAHCACVFRKPEAPRTACKV